jgi:FkbM family methyltransferase
LRGGLFVTEDPEALGGGWRFSSIGSGESAGLPHDQLSQKISLVPMALYREPGRTLNFLDSGPGSHTVDLGFQVQTDTIDNLVGVNCLRGVGFIKMDIEGAEMDALIDAERTIRSHRPKLAISVYHSLQDFVHVPK